MEEKLTKEVTVEMYNEEEGVTYAHTFDLTCQEVINLQEQLARVISKFRKDL